MSISRPHPEIYYVYRDTDGEPLFRVVRRPGKRFAQERWDAAAEQWTSGPGCMDGVQRTLYRLPELRATGNAPVFIVEGERDADNLAELGVSATTSSGGAGKWGQTNSSPLAGRLAIVLPDNDDAGRNHARDACRDLNGKAAEVRVLVLPDLPTKGDVSDWIATRRAAALPDAAIRAELMTLAASAPTWTDGEHAESDLADDDPDAHGLAIVRLADVQPEPVRWLWPGRIARGKLTVLVGDPGLGKTFVGLDVGARVSTGRDWPDCANPNGPGGVVLMTAEDDLADTIRPRLDAAHADAGRIIALQGTKVYSATGPRTVPVTLVDISTIEAAIDGTPGCMLVVLDPISAFCGKVDSHNNTEVRGMLAPLAELAARRGVAVLCVTHLRKGEGQAIYRAMGSLAFVAAARAAWAVAKDKDDPDDERRLLLPVKNNLAPNVGGLAFSLFPSAIPDVPCVAWESQPVHVDVDDALMAPRGTPGRDPDGREAAEKWLLVALADRPRPAVELYDEARDREGIPKRNLERARRELGVIAYRPVNPGAWWWRLSSTPPTTPGTEQSGGLAVCPGDSGNGLFCEDAGRNGAHRQNAAITRATEVRGPIGQCARPMDANCQLTPGLLHGNVYYHVRESNAKAADDDRGPTGRVGRM